MNRARIIIAGVAIIAAIIIGIFASSMLEPDPQPVAATSVPEIVQPPQTDVLVATRELRAGVPLTEADMAWMSLPESIIAPTMILKRNDPQAIRANMGKLTGQVFSAGEPFRQDRLNVTVTGGVLAALLKPGMRAYTMTLDEKLGSTGLIMPRDIVDVVAFGRWDNGAKGAQLIIKGVKILAIGSKTEPTPNTADLRIRTATLEVTPYELELLAKLERNNIPLMLSPMPIEDGKQSQEERASVPVIVYQKRPL
jgi:pilus assembly protein CpaB